jgi:putative membrane protein
MMWWYGDGTSGWGYVLMTACMLLFLSLIIFGVIALVRYVGRTGWTMTANGPEQMLAERFARGEIDEQAYRRGLDVLRSPVVDETLPHR